MWRLMVLMMLGALCATPALAEGSAPAATPATAATGQPHRQTVRQRFEEANTTHDGHLTRAQAEAGFPAMAHLFDAIDRDHKGYITMADIHAYYEAKRAAKAAAAGNTN